MSKARPLIAIVDDEESICRALKRLMVSSGLEVEAYSSGADFFTALKTRRPDCLVLDLHMPVMTGFDVQTKLSQAKDPLPVIAITGHDSTETRQRIFDSGAVAYLRKPIDEQVLLDAIFGAIARAIP